MTRIFKETQSTLNLVKIWYGLVWIKLIVCSKWGQKKDLGKNVECELVLGFIDATTKKARVE